MPATSHRRVWILLLLTSFGIWAPAQTLPETQAQSAVMRIITSPPQHQRRTANYVTVHYELQNPTSEQAGSPKFQAQLADFEGLIPVLTIVGLSFLFGSINSVTNTRP